MRKLELIFAAILIVLMVSWVFGQNGPSVVLKNKLLSGTSFALDLEENRIAYAEGEKLIILDISNPEELNTLAEIDLVAIPSDLKISNQFVYLAFDRIGIYSYDITFPENPLFVSIYPAENQYQRILIEEDQLFFIHDEGLDVLNIAQPEFPRKVRSFHLPTMPNKIALKDQYLLVSTYDALYIVDVETPEMPTIVSELDITYGADVLVKDDYALVSTYNAIYTVDLADVFKPQIVHEQKDFFQISALAKDNSYVYGTSNRGHLVIYILEDDRLRVVNGYDSDQEYVDLVIHNKYVYALDRLGRLDVFNVGDPLNIVKVAHFDQVLYPQVYFIF